MLQVSLQPIFKFKIVLCIRGSDRETDRNTNRDMDKDWDTDTDNLKFQKTAPTIESVHITGFVMYL
jgi:hypothetical protein